MGYRAVRSGRRERKVRRTRAGVRRGQTIGFLTVVFGAWGEPLFLCAHTNTQVFLVPNFILGLRLSGRPNTKFFYPSHAARSYVMIFPSDRAHSILRYHKWFTVAARFRSHPGLFSLIPAVPCQPNLVP